MTGKLRLRAILGHQRRLEGLVDARDPRVGGGQGRVLRVGFGDGPLRDELVLGARRLEVEVALWFCDWVCGRGVNICV